MNMVEHYVKFQKKNVKRRKGKTTVNLTEFYPLSNSKNPDVVASCDKNEITIFVKEISKPEYYTLKDDEIIVRSDEVYEKLIVYAVVRQSLNRLDKIADLKTIVKELGIYEAHFWASSFAETYRATSNRWLLMRPARSFKILHGLVKR